jgi:hypothetical protein
VGWSRDIGVVQTSQVVAAVQAATSRARGELSPEQKARRKSLSDALSSGGVATAAELAELSLLNTLLSPQMSPEEIALVGKVAAVAEAGVEEMGGTAHVVIGGSDRLEAQPEAPEKGSRQTSITVTVTVTTGPAKTEAANPPAKQVDTTAAWEK